MAWRDRIKEFKRVPAEKLRANPKNPAVHGQEQREAMRGILAELGYIDAVIAREVEGGMYELIDGHLRADLSPGQEVPVLVVDLDEREADAALATHDPIGRLADRDEEACADLLKELDALDADFRRFLSTQMPADQALGKTKTDQDGELTGPTEMELRPHEHYDYVIVLAKTIHEWNRLAELLSLPVVTRGKGSLKRIGIGRGVAASKLIELLQPPKPKKEAKGGNASRRRAKSKKSGKHASDASASS